MSNRKNLYQRKTKGIQEMNPDTLCPLTVLYQALAPLWQQIQCPSHDVKKLSSSIITGPITGNCLPHVDQGSDVKQIQSNYRIKSLRVVQTLSLTHQNISF